MLITICGPSGSGKDMIMKYMINNSDHNIKPIVPVTTRPKRHGEQDGIDYHFVSVEEFKKLIDDNKLAYYEEYSQDRFYGVLSRDILKAFCVIDEIYAVIVTPNGLRAIDNITRYSFGMYLSVYINTSLGTRVSRYINRIGKDEFDFDDMNEINARVNRDFGMFLNIEQECDMIIDNPDVDDVSTHMQNIINQIFASDKVSKYLEK